MSRESDAANGTSPAPLPPVAPGFSLPPRFMPRVAELAPGPFIEPDLVTPSDWEWKGARSVIVRTTAGTEYRCLPIHSDRELIGYWAVERLGVTP